MVGSDRHLLAVPVQMQVCHVELLRQVSMGHRRRQVVRMVATELLLAVIVPFLTVLIPLVLGLEERGMTGIHPSYGRCIQGPRSMLDRSRSHRSNYHAHRIHSRTRHNHQVYWDRCKIHRVSRESRSGR